jgi:hypothetical protein
MDLGWPADINWYSFLKDQGSLIGGLLALLAGIVAYVGALMTGKRHIEAARSRNELEDERRRYAAIWTARVEARRIIAAAEAVKNAREYGKHAGISVRASRSQLEIAVADGLRTGGAGVELLPVPLQTLIVDAVLATDEYNAFVELDQIDSKDVQLTNAVIEKLTPAIQGWKTITDEATFALRSR